MRPLSSSDVLATWEAGDAEGPVEQALTLILAGEPELGRAEAEALTIGARDALLLRLRELTFGSVLRAFAECPGCGERLELELDASALAGEPPRAAGTSWEAKAGGVVVHFRLPDSRDLAAAAAASDATAARRLLAERCAIEVRRRGRAVPPAELPDAAVDAMAARMAELAPAADVTLELRCPACSEEWRSGLDVGSFVWGELQAAARRLLVEVDALARAYGWGEAVILGLAPRRRRHYLELALS